MRLIHRLNAVSIFVFLFAAAAPMTGYSQTVPEEYDMREYTSPNGESIVHLVYIPKNLTPGEKYPFVVYLHGSCEECTTHERILKESGLQVWHSYGENKQMEPTFLFAPAGGRRGWTREPRREAIWEIIDGLIEEFPIDTSRIYILGFSMGGQGTWNYLQYRPGFFAAANPQAIGGGQVDAEVVKNTPIWATIGEADQANRIAQLKENIARIRAANGDNRGPLTQVTGVNPRFNTFPGAEHGQAQGETQRMPGFLEWFYSQVNDGNIPPIVKFTSPDITQPVVANSGRLAAIVDAADNDGIIVNIEFRVDGERAGTDRSKPYEFTFTGLTAGEHTLTATAFDNGGKSNTATCTVSVE